MSIWAIIGAGIFILTGVASALYAGPAIIISFVIDYLLLLWEKKFSANWY